MARPDESGHYELCHYRRASADHSNRAVAGQALRTKLPPTCGRPRAPVYSSKGKDAVPAGTSRLLHTPSKGEPRMYRLATALSLFLLLAGLSLQADEPKPAFWPQFRGPNRDGRSLDTRLLKEWPKNGPPLAWKTAGRGIGYSRVSLADGNQYTMGDEQGW